jgi:hypothetical protein
MSAIICDLETISQDPAVILANLPPWDADEARSRVPKSYKKPDAIEGWIEEDKANYGKDAIEKAALNPETATIAVFGTWKGGHVEQLVLNEDGGFPANDMPWVQHLFKTEAELIEHAFMRLRDGTGVENVLGWNLHGFDLMMLVRRAWILGVPVPSTIFNPLSRYHFPDRFVDMMNVFKAGNFKSPHTSLNNALRSVGLPEKGDGKEFGKLWQEDRAKALAYSRDELVLQSQLYRRMGVKL